ncbi:hypothetical protein [Tellurirhabdus rosea]|uniref:hypothetical protein n=1 Tax=Tellurirhabdus rosea TaxID=2674997 RepID=UPI00224D3C99|nr:hypothetical protein [Tellurirhabdus rosea]
MLKKGLLALLCLSFLIASCRRVPAGANVVLTGEPAAGLVSVEATGQGGNFPEMEQNALRKTFETILFVGLPSAATTAYRQPMTDARQFSAADLDQFFRQEQHRPFVVQSRRFTGRRRTAAGGRSLRFAFTINHEALRRHLEQRGLIRPFGY